MLGSNVIVIQSMCINMTIDIERVEIRATLVMSSIFPSEQTYSGMSRVCDLPLCQVISSRVACKAVNSLQDKSRGSRELCPKKGLFYGKKSNESALRDPHSLTGSPTFTSD